jgi:hypothetical protein
MEQQGLAQGRGIGPVYWGGTLMMLLADAEIIEKSGGKKSLADCFQAVLAEGGDTAQRWPLARFIAVCDRATGFGTIGRLAAAHVGTRIDLSAAAARRPVGEYEAGVVYTTIAPLAWVRKKIIAGAHDESRSGSVPRAQGRAQRLPWEDEMEQSTPGLRLRGATPLGLKEMPIGPGQ